MHDEEKIHIFYAIHSSIFNSSLLLQFLSHSFIPFNSNYIRVFKGTFFHQLLSYSSIIWSLGIWIVSILFYQFMSSLECVSDESRFMLFFILFFLTIIQTNTSKDFEWWFTSKKRRGSFFLDYFLIINPHVKLIMMFERRDHFHTHPQPFNTRNQQQITVDRQHSI